MQVSAIEITCARRGPKWFRVLDYGFKRVGMSRGEKIRSIDACLYFCRNSLSLPYHLIFLFSFKFLFSFLSGHFLSTSCHSFLLPFVPCSWLPLSLLYLLKFMGFLPFVPKDVTTTFGIFPRLPTSLLVARPLPLLRGCLPHHSPFPNKNYCFVLSCSLPCLPSTDKG